MQRFNTATNTGNETTGVSHKNACPKAKTKVDESKVVEINEDRKKVLMAENIDKILRVKEQTINFNRKFPSWTLWVRPPSPAPKFLKRISILQTLFPIRFF